LKNQPEVRLVGEASDLPEAIRKTAELHPDVIVLDLHLTEKNGAIELTALLGAARVLAITFGTDEVSTVLAEHIGAETLIDKMDLTAELVPAILQLSLQKRSPSSAFPVGGSPAG
jgi:DNA-binding NarL/FixJ family response regulator